MYAELRSRSQITIPKTVIKELNIKEGDKFEIETIDGEIRLIPIVVYPKKYVEELENEVKKVKEQIANGKARVYNTTDELFAHLDGLK